MVAGLYMKSKTQVKEAHSVRGLFLESEHILWNNCFKERNVSFFSVVCKL